MISDIDDTIKVAGVADPKAIGLERESGDAQMVHGSLNFPCRLSHQRPIVIIATTRWKPAIHRMAGEFKKKQKMTMSDAAIRMEQ
ncbi:MAG: hypothetical protein PHV34_19710 [Verrucomicrobiae bacterium]|nr:hypothetical protein [Verrucomicrobiae bacterium]